MTMQKKIISIRTTTHYTVEIPHAGYVSVKDILADLSQIPENALLCGFDDKEHRGVLKFNITEDSVSDKPPGLVVT